MGEVLRNSASAIITASGFACRGRGGLYGRPRTSDYRICCRKYDCCMFHGSNVKLNRRCILCGCIPIQGPRMSLMYGKIKLRNSIIASIMVASIEPELACENGEESLFTERREENLDLDYVGNNLPPWGNVVEPELACEDGEENLLIERREENLDLDYVGNNFPPWGNVVVQRGSDVEDKNGSQPLTVSQKMAVERKIRVHLLEETNEEILSRRVLILSRSNKVRSALELHESMKFSGLRPNVHACNSLISCLVRNRLLDNALRVFEFMRTNEITTGHSYSLILKAVADTWGFDLALDMFVEFGGYSSQKRDFDVIVYNTMISVCSRVNHWIETEKLWRSLKENGLIGTQVTYSLLVCIFVRCGRNELALDAYNEMIQNGLKPGDDVIQAVIGSCTKEGKWDLALKLFQNMLNDGLKPNLTSCNTLINSLGKAGKVKLAFKVHGITKSLGHASDAFTWNGLLTALYKANLHVDVLQLFESIKTEHSSQLNVHLYHTALMSCQKVGLWEKSLQLLWQMEASGLPVSTSSYNLVIGACEIARKPKIALQVYEHMVHQKCTPNTFTHLSLIRGCIWGSLWDEVEEILEVEPDVSLYNAVIQGMCLRRKFESAKQLYLKMRESGLKPDGKTRALMLQNLNRKT